MKKPSILSTVKTGQKKAGTKNATQTQVFSESVVSSDDVLMKLIRDAVLTLDADFRILHWNKGAEEMYGWKEEEVLGKISYKLFNTDFGKESPNSIREELITKGFYRKEFIHADKHGNQIHVHTSASAITDQSGIFLGIILIIKNITERKKRELELANHAALIDNIKDAVLSLDKNFRIKTWNKGAEKIYGWTESEAVGQFVYELLQTNRGHDLSLEKLKKIHESEGYYNGDIIHKTKSGETKYIQLSSSAVFDEEGIHSGMVAICKDNTEHKKQEDQLKYHAALMESIKDAVFSIDMRFEIKSWNKGAEEMYGWTEQEAIGRLSYELLESDYSPSTPEDLRVSFKQNGFVNLEVTQKTKYGKSIIVVMSASALYDQDGVMSGAVTLNKDITDIKKNEIRLQKLSDNLTGQVAIHTRELTNIFERVTDGFIALDIDWNYTYMNKTGGEIFHCDPEKMIGKYIWEEFPEATGRVFYASCMKAMETQEFMHQEDFYPVHQRWIEFNIYPSKEGLSIYFKDITDKKHAEQTLEKANRLYKFISSINQMIVRTTDETTLFSEACKIAIHIGKFKMAWVGFPDPKSRIVKPVMFDGLDIDYLKNIKIIADKNYAEGRGPVGRALDEGVSFFCNDIANDPVMAPWREEALKRNFLSTIALPIRRLGKAIGVFTIYAGSPDFFDEQEISLLEEVADDISFALDFIEKEAMRKRSQESLIKSERRYQSLSEVSPTGIFHTNKEGLVTYVNPKWISITGLSFADALGHGWQKSVFEEDRDHLFSTWKNILTHEISSQLEFRFQRPDKSIAWVISQTIPERNFENQVIGYVGTITDITERKKAEASIIKANDQLKLSQKIAKIGYWEKDLIGDNNYWSEEMFRLCEMVNNGSVISQEDFFNRIHPEDKEMVLEKINSIITDIENFGSEEYRFIAKDGTIRHMLSTGQLIRDKEGNPIRINGTMQDITERRNIQLEIVKEKYLSESVIDNLPGIFYMINQKGRFIRWNRNFEEVMEYSSAEIEKMNRLDLAVEEEKELIARSISETLTAGKEGVLTHFITKEGKIIPFHLTGMAIEYNAERCLMIMGIDFSERARIQEDIDQTSRQLQALTDHLQNIREEERKRIGRELHDELGQQLTAMKMDIAWINKKTPDDSGLIKEKMKEVIELLDGSNASLRRILNELRPTILDQHGLLDALHWHAKQFTANTNIPVQIKTSKHDIKVSDQIATCIFRVFQESLTNITRYAEAEKVVTSLEIQDGNIIIEIEDNGKGFDTLSEQPKSRQPFGILGMKERVRALNGRFALQSELGEGTKIHISLPLEF